VLVGHAIGLPRLVAALDLFRLAAERHKNRHLLCLAADSLGREVGLIS
jgi:hypothetical protein